jgi:hypothetical protein
MFKSAADFINQFSYDTEGNNTLLKKHYLILSCIAKALSEKAKIV